MIVSARTYRVDLPDLAATAALARRVGGLLAPGDAVLAEGPLGAGKSAFFRALLRSVTGEAELDVPSPSYTLVQSYDTPVGVVHHFDLWRLDGPAGLLELGWDDARRDIVLVEWPERLGVLRPAEGLTIELRVLEETRRRVVLSGWPSRIGGLV
jgi:tRNA threonylcarbamoyladenosine biosynthesis protein TsaE